MYLRNRKFFITVITTFLLSLLFASTSTNAQKRIVSLVPSITKQIYVLGAEDMLVGCTSFCDVNEKDNIEIVASAIDVNIEKVVSLKPDIIFVSSLVKPQTLATFEKLGLKTENIPTAKNFEELCEYFITIGNLIDKPTEAKQIATTYTERIEELKKRIPPNKKQKIFMEIGAKPLFTVTPNTFMDDYINFVGGINIASDLKHGTITRESVLVRDPDIIFIVSMGVVGEEETKTWKKYKNLSATQNNKIFVLDANVASVPTPGNFVKIVEEMINAMY